MHKSIIYCWVAGVPFAGFNPEARAEQLRAFRDPDLYNRALELRQAGWSYKMIEAELGVSRSTLSGWLPGVVFQAYHPTVQQRVLKAQQKAVERNKQRKQQAEAHIRSEAAQETKELLAGGLNDRELFLLGLILYWAEGAKTPGQVSLSNSDPALIRMFVLWLQHSLSIDRTQLRVRVHIYPDVAVDEAEQHWANIVGVPRSQFYRSQIDHRPDKVTDKQGKLPYGTAHVRVVGQGTSDLQRRIMAWIANSCGIIDATLRE